MLNSFFRCVFILASEPIALKLITVSKCSCMACDPVLQITLNIMQEYENRPLPKLCIFFSSPRISSFKILELQVAKRSKPEKGTQHLISLQKLRFHSHRRATVRHQGASPRHQRPPPPGEPLEQCLKYKGLSHASIFFLFYNMRQEYYSLQSIREETMEMT